MSPNEKTAVDEWLDVTPEQVQVKAQEDWVDYQPESQTAQELAHPQIDIKPPKDMNIVHLEDKNVNVAFPSDLPDEEVGRQIQERFYSIPVTVPPFISDQLR